VSQLVVPRRIERSGLTVTRPLAEPTLAVASFVAIAGLAAANGGFFPASWGWSALALLWLAVVTLIVRPVDRPGKAELAFAGVIVVGTAWTWTSIAWSSDQTQSVLEGERALVPVAGIAAVYCLAGRRPVRLIVGGVFSAIVAVAAYALLTRLLPDQIGTYDRLAVYRLATPIGYWNGLGIFAVMGLLLALGIAARTERTWARVLAAASLVVLLPTLYFTFSRGSWIALGAGLLVLVAIDPRRLRTITAALAYLPAPAAAVVLASRSHALTHPHSAVARAAHDGHRLASVMLGLLAAQCLIALAFGPAQERLAPTRAVRVGYASALLVALVAGLAAVFLHYGSPISIAQRGYHSFTTAPPNRDADLNQRLFDFSGNGRWTLWQVSWQQANAHPLLGNGAGSFEQYWNQHRPVAMEVQDAHNLYLETLSERGPIGLALLAALLALPVAAAVRARRHPLVPAAGAAFAAYIVHATADWDWELAGVTLAAVLLGTACVLARRELDDTGRPQLSAADRNVALAALVAVAAVALIGLLGNVAAGMSDRAARNEDWSSAERHARQAIRWMPWSSVGWRELGEAQLVQGDVRSARHSLRQAIAKDPRNWVLWLDLAAAEQGPARRAALRTARQLNPLSRALRQFGGV
jgi:cytochrome c-type biogenesis protein CcmH/NrfG